MRRLGRQHPRLGYGPRFEAWLANPDPQPYGLSLIHISDAKSRGGDTPRPPGLWPARSHSLVLGLGATLFRWLGYYGTHLRALIWIRILREQGLRKNELRCGGVAPTKASPWGEAVTEGD